MSLKSISTGYPEGFIGGYYGICDKELRELKSLYDSERFWTGFLAGEKMAKKKNKEEEKNIY